jgi:hypothetical protein
MILREVTSQLRHFPWRGLKAEGYFLAVLPETEKRFIYPKEGFK